RPIHPDPHDIARDETPGGVHERHLLGIQEDFSAFERGHRAAARAEPIGGGKKLVEPRAGLAGVDGPLVAQGAPRASAIARSGEMVRPSADAALNVSGAMSVRSRAV